MTLSELQNMRDTFRSMSYLLTKYAEKLEEEIINQAAKKES